MEVIMKEKKEPIKDILDNAVNDNSDILKRNHTSVKGVIIDFGKVSLDEIKFQKNFHDTLKKWNEHNKNAPLIFVPNDNVERELITFMQNKYGFNLQARIDKLCEEQYELLAELGVGLPNGSIYEINKDRVLDEIGDCMAVMLHIAHSFGVESTEILSRTLQKLKHREIDPSYKKE